MPTVQNLIDIYNKNPEVRAIIDAQVGGYKEQYKEVVIFVDGHPYTFRRVVEFTNLTNYAPSDVNKFRLIHSDMMFGHITDYTTEIIGRIKIKTRKTGEREYEGE